MCVETFLYIYEHNFVELDLSYQQKMFQLLNISYRPPYIKMCMVTWWCNIPTKWTGDEANS